MKSCKPFKVLLSYNYLSLQSPTTIPQGNSVSVNLFWQHLYTFSNSAVPNSISLRHKAVHIFFSHCTEGQKSKLKV